MAFIEQNPASSADYLVTIQDLPNTYWNTFSGIKNTAKRPTYHDALSGRKRTAQTGSDEFADSTMSKPYDPEKDAEVLKWIENHRDGTPFDILIRPVSRGSEVNQRPNTGTHRLGSCRLMGHEIPGEIDVAKGDQTSMITITFSVEDYTYA